MLRWAGGGPSDGGGVEDAVISQGFSGFVRRFGLPIYVFCVGETVYPWNWTATIPGILASLAAFISGAWYLRKRTDIVVPATCAIAVLLFAISLSGKLGIMQTSGSMAKRASFVIPLFCVTLAAGITSLRSRPLRLGIASVIFLVWTYSLYNYWSGQQFLNQNYTATWDLVFNRMEKEHFAGNSVMITSEPVIRYTLSRKYPTVALINAAQESNPDTVIQKTIAQAAQNHARYIYFVGRDRGARNSVTLGDEICEKLSHQYRCDIQAGFMPRTESEKHWLSVMLKRPTSPYYIWLSRYDLETPAAL